MMRKHISIVFLALSILLVGVASAHAFGEIRYPDRPLNLRDARSPKGKWVGSLYPGQKVRVAFLKDGWVAIFEPNEKRNTEAAAVGFSNAKYLKKKRTTHKPKPWGELMYTPRKLNIRSKPSTKGDKLDMLSVNERVKIDFPDDDWSMVFYPDATIRSKMNARGFSSNKYFKPVTASAPKPTAATAPAPAAVKSTPKKATSATVAAPAPAATSKKSMEEWGTVITVKRKVNVRAKRTSSSHYVRTLQPGSRVRVDYLKNGWYAVFLEDELIHSESRAMGYALKSLLESDGSEPAPTAVPAAKKQSAWKTSDSGQKSMVIDKASFKKTKRPDPTPNKTAHGYQYRLLEKKEMKKYGESWITLKVFLSVRKLPGNEALRDFATTLWKEHKRATRNLAVLVYLPGQDTDSLAYAVIQFSDEKLLEFWARKTTLFGTDFL